MGSGIAAQLANAGIPSYLMDIVPKALSDKEKAQGLTEQSPAFRNRIAAGNKELIIKSKPALLMDKDNADLITVGNTVDNLDWLTGCDWVVEVVPENIDIKKGLLKTIAPYIKPGTIVTSNTSSISINAIVEDMPLEFRQYWMGTHFFNPVRYMKLLELIPGTDTLPEVIEFIANFGETVLGKGIVWAKDTPAFVANRLGNFAGPCALRLMAEYGLSIEEIDAITGSAIGRPGTGSFGLYDLVGLDIGIASAEEVAHHVTDPAEIAAYTMPDWFHRIADAGILGNKTKGGFYKKVGKEKLVLNIDTLDYRPARPVQFDSLDAAKKAKTLPEKLACFFEGNDKAAQFTWKNITSLFLYTASKIPEVADDIVNMDRGLCWGYNHKAGPFQIWNGLDLEKYIKRMEDEGNVIPAWIKEMFAVGIKSFYKTENGIEYYYSIPDKKYMPIVHKPEVIVLKELKDKVVKDSADATLYDIGDGIICLEMHTKGSVVTAGLIQFIKEAQKELDDNWDGMVITGSGKNFCMGADMGAIAGALQSGRFDAIDALLASYQDTFRSIKYSCKPVVAAVNGMTMGTGVEMLMQCPAVQAVGESYIGIVDIGLGLIPAAGAIREIVFKIANLIKGTDASPVELIAKPYFESIAQAKVSTSAAEAIKLGYLRPTDGITLNPDYLIADAKRRVLNMIGDKYTPPVRKSAAAFGQGNMSLLKLGTRQMMESGVISEHDWHIYAGIADIAGGSGVVKGGLITEEFIDNQTREFYISLCKNPKTQERIAHMLKTGKPLRN
jgi:3-hydroxyacyl-CoA dehydrogenase